jgi:hypothetical protein
MGVMPFRKVKNWQDTTKSEIMNTPPVWVLISQAAQAVRGRYSSAPGASMPEK